MRFIINTKILIVTIGLIAFSVIVINMLLIRKFDHSKTTKVYTETSILPYVVVHIDLKGNPPKLEYLESLLPILKEYGANGLLIEYEDMFPFDSNLGLADKHCYSPKDLRYFLTQAAHLGFEIIPLIQTFGHMEYVLKLQEYKHLREDPLYFDSICPSRPQSIVVIKEMLAQVINFHKDISTLNFIHIGCDEVYHINKCDLCRKMELENLDIFVNHLQNVVGVVGELSPATKVLIWDDMFRGIKSDLPDTILMNTEPVYWDYRPQPTISHLDLMKYRRKFRNIWIASAFKGADGRNSVLPNLNDRFLNHLSWMTAISNYKFGGESSAYGFSGIILTGWSRYSHMDPPCELLPASIHSLILNLLVVKLYKGKNITDIEKFSSDEVYKQYIERDFKKVFHNSPTYRYKVTRDTCIAQSENLIDLLQTYEDVIKEIDKGFADGDKGFPMIEFNTKHCYINRMHANNALRWCKEKFKTLDNLEYNLRNVLLQFYENHILKEYINYLFYPIQSNLKNSTRLLNTYLYTISWRNRY